MPQILAILSLAWGFFPTQVVGASCFDRILVCGSSIILIEGTEYSNCILEFRFDSNALWFTRSILVNNPGDHGQGLWREDWDLSRLPFYIDQVTQGKSSREASHATHAALLNAPGTIANALNGVLCREDYNIRVKVLGRFASDLQIGIVWNEELGQPFISVPPMNEWTSLGPELLVMSRPVEGDQEAPNICDITQEMRRFVSGARGGMSRAVVILKGEIYYLEGGTMEELAYELERF